MVPGWFFIVHVVNTLKLYSGPTIQSRPCRPKAGFGLVYSNFHSTKGVLALLQGGGVTYDLHLYLIGSSAKDYMTAS